MLNKPQKLCRDCQKNPPRPGRRNCLSCIQSKEKEKMRERKKRNQEKEVERKHKAKKKKAFSESKLTDIADKMFSLYIRKRDE